MISICFPDQVPSLFGQKIVTHPSFPIAFSHWEGINTSILPIFLSLLLSSFNPPGPHCTPWFLDVQSPLVFAAVQVSLTMDRGLGPGPMARSMSRPGLVPPAPSVDNRLYFPGVSTDLWELNTVLFEPIFGTPPPTEIALCCPRVPS